MDTLKRITEIQGFMLQSETQLQCDLKRDLKELVARRFEIEEKYGRIKQKAIDDCQSKKDKIQEVCNKAQQLINGIRRKLFRKQDRRISEIERCMIFQTSEEALEKLEDEIKRFEKTNLPFRVRQFIDGVCLLFNSNYGQEDVDRINGLYIEIKRIQDNGELDKQLKAELSAIDEERLKEIHVIDRMMSSIVSERVEDYIYSLKTKIFSA